MRPKPKKWVQLELKPRTWGGARAGAGRPRSSKQHSRRKRPEVVARFPLHVTQRIRWDVPSLRDKKRFDVIKRAFHGGCERFGMRLCEFSVQDDHIHLVVEAADKRALSHGMQGRGVRIARRVNRSLKRSGQVIADRYHARPLCTPTEARNAVHYVRYNMQKHRKERGLATHKWALDPCSSVSGQACWYDEEAGAMTVASARTWLLRRGAS